MSAILRNLAELASLAGWAGMWALGGWLIVRRAFNLRPNEQSLVGLAVGLIVENWLANLLAQVLPLVPSFWLAAGLTLAVGVVFWLPLPADWRARLKPNLALGQWLLLAALVFVFTGIGRGLAIYDDYAHLPTTSLIAAGDMLPHFALDPNVPYGYHHFLMLFAAQTMRVAGFYPWTALDIIRALSLGLAILLAAAWTRRLTRSRTAGLLGGLMLAFGMGARWLLLLLPSGLLVRVSGQITLLGSAAESAPDLAAGLLGSWNIQGGGPLAFPFAFANGLYPPGVMNLHGANGNFGPLVILLLLLTFNRWRGWRGGVVTGVVWASLSLMTESGILLTLLGWAVVTVIWMLREKTWRLPGSLWGWWAALAGSSLVSLIQGGALSEMAAGWVDKNLMGITRPSYQTVGFQLVWPPEIVSSHLGPLSLFNPAQLLAALCEIGPVLLVFPLVILWGIKALRCRRWFEAALVVTAVLSLGMTVIEFTGSAGVRNTSRLYEFIDVCALFAVPLVWNWARRRSEGLRALALGLGVVTMLGGVVIFGTELPAAQKPVYSYFITDLDAQMMRDYWNRLEPGAVVFDPSPYRAPVVFGRHTNSSTTWFAAKPEWRALKDAPDPRALRAAGFSYAYIDSKYWDSLSPAYQQQLTSGCARVMQEFSDWTHDFRRLIDLRGCS